MASSDDISVLIGRNAKPDTTNPTSHTYRQGTILTFDPATGNNTVNLAGAVLTNLPVVNIGDSVTLRPGDAILIGKMNHAMFILGRVVPAGSGPAWAFRQGTIITFNPLTGANTVNLDGATLTNLPLINLGDTTNLGPGDSVILFRTNTVPPITAILGRLVPAGSSVLYQQVVSTDGTSNGTSNFALTTAYVNHSSVALTAPSWANQVQLTCISCVTARNNSGPAVHGIFLQTRIEGNDSVETFVSIGSGEVGALTAAHQQNIAITGGQVLNASSRMKADVAFASDTATTSTCTFNAIYTRV